MTTHGNDVTSSTREYLNTKQAAQRMGLSVETVRAMCNDGVLDGAERSGRDWRIPSDAVVRWLQSSSGAPRPVNHADTPAASAPVMPQPGPPTRWQRFRYNPWVFYSAVVFSTSLVLATAFFGLISAGADFGPFSQQVKAWGFVREFPSERKGETLIVVAEFYRTEGVIDSDAHNEIRRAIELAAQKTGESKLRVEVSSVPIAADDQDQARSLGDKYDASIVIWGADTGVRVMVNFLNRKQPDCASACLQIDETQRTQIASPSAYGSFVTKELPGQLSFISLYTVGQWYYNQGAYAESIEAIESGITSLGQQDWPPDGLSDVYLRLGWLYQTVGDGQQAIKRYTRAIELNPRNAIAFNNRGAAFAYQENIEAAIQDFTQAITMDTQLAVAYKNRGHALTLKGEMDAAIQDFIEAINLNPLDAGTYNYRGAAYQEQGDLDTAILDYNKAIEIDPQYAPAYFSRGRARDDQGNLDAAIEDYTRTIELDPENSAAYNNRANARFDQGDLYAANQDYDKAIELDPQDAVAYFNRGKVRAAQGELEAAVQDFTRAIELDPPDADAYINRGRARAEQLNLKAAIQDYDAAIKLDPQNAGAYVYRGKAYFYQGDIGAAIGDYTQAIELDSQNADAYINRGYTYHDQGNLSAAIEDYTMAISLNSELALAYFNRGLARSLQSDPMGAITDMRRYLELDPASPDRQRIEQGIAELEKQLSGTQPQPGATP